MAIVNTCKARRQRGGRERTSQWHAFIRRRVAGREVMDWAYLPGEHWLHEEEGLDEDAQADGQRAQDEAEHDAAPSDRQRHQHALQHRQGSGMSAASSLTDWSATSAGQRRPRAASQTGGGLPACLPTCAACMAMMPDVMPVQPASSSP